MLHEGGPGYSVWYCQYKRLTRLACKVCRLQFALIGFLKNLALHLEPSPSIHSYSYGFSGDTPSCLASFPGNSDSFMQHAR